MAESYYYVRETFFVATRDGGTRKVTGGTNVEASDPVVKTHAALLQPMSERIAQTAAGQTILTAIRLPSGVTEQEATQARDTRTGTRSTKESDMPHALPPEHEDSPASPFAPGQPAAGIVADDVPPEQNPAGRPKAADAPTIVNTSPEPQTAQQEANAEAQKDANKAAKASKAK